MAKDNLRKIPAKNYIILGIVMIVTFFLLYYFYMWVDAYKDSKINIPILDKYMSVINYNELDNYVVENPNAIVYVSVLEDEVVRDFEKKLKDKYKADEVNNEILYMNVTEELGDKDVKKYMKVNYSLNNLDITGVPCLLVFNDGVLKSIYNVSDNGYDVERFVIYVNNIVLESE